MTKGIFQSATLAAERAAAYWERIDLSVKSGDYEGFTALLKSISMPAVLLPRALLLTVECGNRDMLYYILELDKVFITPTTEAVCQAVWNDQSDIFSALIGSAEVMNAANLDDVLSEVARHNRVVMFDSIVRRVSSSRLGMVLCESIRSGSYDVFGRVVGKPIPDKAVWDALKKAAKYNRKRMLRELLAEKKDLAHDPHLSVALEEAAKRGHGDIVKVLAKAGAADAKRIGLAIFMAMRRDDGDMCRVLNSAFGDTDAASYVVVHAVKANDFGLFSKVFDRVGLTNKLLGRAIYSAAKNLNGDMIAMLLQKVRERFSTPCAPSGTAAHALPRRVRMLGGQCDTSLEPIREALSGGLVEAVKGGHLGIVQALGAEDLPDFSKGEALEEAVVAVRVDMTEAVMGLKGITENDLLCAISRASQLEDGWLAKMLSNRLKRMRATR